MNHFAELFYAIDKDQTETISKEELQTYVKENQLDFGMVKRWEELFDKDGTGIITFANFCNVLGLKPEELRMDFAQKYAAEKIPKLGSDIEVIFEDMALDLQIEISDEARRITEMNDILDEREVAQRLKRWLDEKYKQAWHVIIVKGSYWASYSHFLSHSFHFRLNEKSYVIWRSPK